MFNDRLIFPLQQAKDTTENNTKRKEQDGDFFETSVDDVPQYVCMILHVYIKYK